jgi:hypothetical protein
MKQILINVWNFLQRAGEIRANSRIKFGQY